MRSMVVFSLIHVALLVGCGNAPETRSLAELAKEENDPILRAMATLEPHIQVQSYKVEGAPLDDGYAVVVLMKYPQHRNEPAFYWVRGSEAFAVNELARETSPRLPAPPANITLERVMKVLPPEVIHGMEW